MSEHVIMSLIGGPFCGQTFIGHSTHNNLVIAEADLLTGQLQRSVYTLKEKTASTDEKGLPVHKFVYCPKRSREWNAK